MKFYLLVIKYRLWLSLVAILLAAILNITGASGFWAAFPLYFIGLIGVVSHFIIGPLRLVQEPMEAGDFDEVEKILSTIWYPSLLLKPLRSSYYTIKGNLAMMKKDFDSAEKHLKHSSSLGAPVPQAEANNKLQLGMMAMQKNDFKQAESHIRAALRLGLADKESEAVAFLGLCQIFIQRRQFKAGKDFFRKAKELKPKNPQVLDQIKEIDKYISRMPG